MPSDMQPMAHGCQRGHRTRRPGLIDTVLKNHTDLVGDSFGGATAIRASALPAHQLRDLNEIAAGVVEHGDLGGCHVRWWHGELGAARLHTLVIDHFLKMALGISAWTPLVPSTICVTTRSMTALDSRYASSRFIFLISTIQSSISRVAIRAASSRSWCNPMVMKCVGVSARGCFNG